MNHTVDLQAKLLAQSRDAAETARQLADCIYRGTDLSVKFADEIAAAPYSGDAWAWIKGRIQTGNYAGIHIFDWLPFTADGHDYQAQIAGINTATDYGDTPIGNHIDFITKELWHVKHRMNPIEYNNGAVLPDGTTQASPWLISDLKHFLNSESGYVVTGRNPVTVGTVDYSDSGVFKHLPAALKSVIIEKRVKLLGRYASYAEMGDPTSIQWDNIGKLWLPTEYEVLGMDSIGATSAIRIQSFVAQYPLFVGNAGSRLKKLGTAACGWWLMSPTRNNKNWTGIGSDAAANQFGANVEDNGFPVCFRIG